MIRLPRRRLVVPLVAILAATTGVAFRLTGDDSRARPAAVPSAAAPPAVTLPSPVLPSSPSAQPPPPGSSPDRPGHDGAPGPSRTTGPQRPDLGGPIPPARRQEASIDEMLQRERPPPEGVAEQLEFFVGGGPECPPDQSPGEMVVAAPEVVTIPSAPLFCLLEFRGNVPVTLEVTPPAGSTFTKALPPDWDATTEPVFPFPPGSPEGRYTVDAHQGNDHARTTFVARRTDHPTMAITPLRAAAGSTIDVFVGGLPPGKTTDVHLYACPGPTDGRGSHFYQATHTVTANAAGDARLALHTSRSTPATCYVLGSLEIIDPKSLPDGGLPTYLQFAIYEAKP